MAIQKKSLISNRAATKKALVAKPEVSTKSGVTRLKVGPTRVASGPTRVAAGPTRVAAGPTRLRSLH